MWIFHEMVTSTNSSCEPPALVTGKVGPATSTCDWKESTRHCTTNYLIKTIPLLHTNFEHWFSFIHMTHTTPIQRKIIRNKMTQVHCSTNFCSESQVPCCLVQLYTRTQSQGHFTLTFAYHALNFTRKI